MPLAVLSSPLSCGWYVDGASGLRVDVDTYEPAHRTRRRRVIDAEDAEPVDHAATPLPFQGDADLDRLRKRELPQETTGRLDNQADGRQLPDVGSNMA
jgi:hypothetical protein